MTISGCFFHDTSRTNLLKSTEYIHLEKIVIDTAHFSIKAQMENHTL